MLITASAPLAGLALVAGASRDGRRVGLVVGGVLVVKGVRLRGSTC
jgi:hypothetical protein